MNAYSTHFFLNLKIKIYQLLGIANAVALQELVQRSKRLETKMDRIGVRLRRGQIKKASRTPVAFAGVSALSSNEKQEDLFTAEAS